MARVLIDTDILIDHLRLGRKVPVKAGEGAYSVIARAELYAGKGIIEELIDKLLSAFEEVPVDRKVAQEAGRIRRERSVALPDAIIAATAITGGMALLTRNVRHFQRVPELRFHIPSKV